MDPAERRWYVPDGLDLAYFNAWLPTEVPPAAPAARDGQGQVIKVPAGNAQVTSIRLMPAYSATLPTTAVGQVEIAGIQTRSNNTFLDLAQHDATHQQTASARAIIWAGRLVWSTGLSLPPACNWRKV